jgi:uncharacterized low-complexity protein
LLGINGTDVKAKDGRGQTLWCAKRRKGSDKAIEGVCGAKKAIERACGAKKAIQRSV